MFNYNAAIAAMVKLYTYKNTKNQAYAIVFIGRYKSNLFFCLLIYVSRFSYP